MSQAGERAFAALQQYFLGRLQQEMDLEYEQKRDEQRTKQWRDEQAQIGEKNRGVQQRLVGGQLMQMDVAQKWDPQSNSWREIVYGARPAPEPRPKGSEFSRIVLADGTHANHPRTEPLPPGARFYDAAAERPQRGGRGSGSGESKGWRSVQDPDDPNQSIFVDDSGNVRMDAQGRPLRPTPKSSGSSKPQRPESPMRDGRSKTGAYELVQGDPVRDKDGNVIGAPVFVMPPSGGSAPAQQAQGPQLDPDGARMLAAAKAQIAARPDARKIIEQRLRESGNEDLIQYL